MFISSSGRVVRKQAVKSVNRYGSSRAGRDRDAPQQG